MEFDELKQLIQQAVDRIPTGSVESAYQKELERVLRERGLQPLPRSRKAMFDIGLDEPRTLIEIKRSGDWRCVAEAATELFVYASQEQKQEGKMLAVFGSTIQHGEVLRDMLRKLNIEYVERSSTSDAIN
jgi:hypothetical protein